MYGDQTYVPNNPPWKGLYPPNHTSTRIFDPNRAAYSFYESTINWVYGNSPRRIFHENPDGTRAIVQLHEVLNFINSSAVVYEEWQCRGGCQRWYRYEALQIDHSPTIQTHFNNVRPSTWAEGMRAYNDVSILRLMCTTCNTCHCWEGNSDSDSGSD